MVRHTHTPGLVWHACCDLCPVQYWTQVTVPHALQSSASFTVTEESCSISPLPLFSLLFSSFPLSSLSFSPLSSPPLLSSSPLRLFSPLSLLFPLLSPLSSPPLLSSLSCSPLSSPPLLSPPLLSPSPLSPLSGASSKWMPTLQLNAKTLVCQLVET